MMGTNGTRAPARPAVSLIVVSSGEVGADASLELLRQQCAASDAELIVVRAGDRHAGEGGAGSADVVFVDRPAGTPLAELRAAGMRVARGDVVALTDDRSATATSRLAHLLACYRRGTGDRTLSHSR